MVIIFAFALLLTSFSFSCTPPQRESSLSGYPVVVSLNTVTNSSTICPQSNNIRAADDSCESALNLESEQIGQKQSREIILSDESAALEKIYFEWPGNAAPIVCLEAARLRVWQANITQSNCP